MKSTSYLLAGWVPVWLIRSTWKWYVSTRKESEKTLDSTRGRILCTASSTAFFYLRDQLCFCGLNSIYENTSPNNLNLMHFFWLAQKDITSPQYGSHVTPLLLVKITNSFFAWPQLTKSRYVVGVCSQAFLWCSQPKVAVNWQAWLQWLDC